MWNEYSSMNIDKELQKAIWCVIEFVLSSLEKQQSGVL